MLATAGRFIEDSPIGLFAYDISIAAVSSRNSLRISPIFSSAMRLDFKEILHDSCEDQHKRHG